MCSFKKPIITNKNKQSGEIVLVNQMFQNCDFIVMWGLKSSIFAKESSYQLGHIDISRGYSTKLLDQCFLRQDI